MDPFAEIDEMFTHLPALRSRGALQGSSGFIPAVNMYEEGGNIVVETPLAGTKPEDVEVSIEKGVLTIEGKSETEHEIDEKNYYRKEVRTGSFHRKVPLPAAVKEDEVNAEFENGVLRITAPKAEPGKSKKVSVKVKKRKSN